MPKQKDPVGRPPTVEGKNVTVYLNNRSCIEADRIGKGNSSAGIRLALNLTRHMTLGEIMKAIAKGEK